MHFNQRGMRQITTMEDSDGMRERKWPYDCRVGLFFCSAESQYNPAEWHGQSMYDLPGEHPRIWRCAAARARNDSLQSSISYLGISMDDRHIPQRVSNRFAINDEAICVCARRQEMSHYQCISCSRPRCY